MADGYSLTKEKVEPATVSGAAGSSVISCKTTNYNCSTNYINFTLQDEKAISSYLYKNPDSTCGDVSNALQLDFAYTRDLLRDMANRGLLCIQARAHYHVNWRR